MDNPCSSWLSDSNWDNITELDKLTNFHGLMASFEQYPRDWHLWYTNPEPEKAPLPGNVCVCVWGGASSFVYIVGTFNLILGYKVWFGLGILQSE